MTGQAQRGERPHPLLRFLMHFMTPAQLAEVERDLTRYNAAIEEELRKSRHSSPGRPE